MREAVKIICNITGSGLKVNVFLPARKIAMSENFNCELCHVFVVLAFTTQVQGHGHS